MTRTTTPDTKGAPEMSETFDLNGIDYVEFWVGNARQSAYFYEHAFGFTPVAYCGPETGIRDRASYVLEQGEIRFVFTSAIVPDHPIAEHHALHGDGVHDVALGVPDVDAAWAIATSRGATGAYEPRSASDDDGQVRLAGINTYGETIHTLIDRSGYDGAFLPGYEALPQPAAGERAGIGLRFVDHVVGNTEDMNPWVDFYERVLGFSELAHFTDSDITTEYSALMSKVVQNGDGRVKFPINEPATGKRKSQIEEYLEAYRGAGVQHIALLTDDIIRTVDELHRRGVRFLETPDSYYDAAEERVGQIDEQWADLRRTGVLVDRDDEGYLLQIFTKPVQDRPTVFYEIIQRKGSRGFGEGNFKALFEAIEREQALRGNL